MAKKTRGLSRGLDALLPVDIELEAGLQQIPVGDIDPNGDQPRQTFVDETIEQLADSIRDQGVLQPLLVTPTAGGRYMIVAGERRWRASRLAGLDTVPCIVRDMDIIQQMEVALIENLQREDLNAIDAAMGISSLMRQCGYTQEAVAQRLGKSRPAVANLLRLLSLPESVQNMLTSGLLTSGHGRVLAGLDSKELQISLARRTVDEGLSVRQLETIAAESKKAAVKTPARKTVRQLPAELEELEGRILGTMGVKAAISGNMKKGRIVLSYTSREQLEQFNEVLLKLGGME